MAINTATQSTRISETRAVLDFFDHEAGVQAGSFTTKLIGTAASADPLNARLLALGFPWLVALVNAAQNTEDALETMAESLEPGSDQEPVRALVHHTLFRMGITEGL